MSNLFSLNPRDYRSYVISRMAAMSLPFSELLDNRADISHDEDTDQANTLESLYDMAIGMVPELLSERGVDLAADPAEMVTNRYQLQPLLDLAFELDGARLAETFGELGPDELDRLDQAMSPFWSGMMDVVEMASTFVQTMHELMPLRETWERIVVIADLLVGNDQLEQRLQPSILAALPRPDVRPEDIERTRMVTNFISVTKPRFASALSVLAVGAEATAVAVRDYGRGLLAAIGPGRPDQISVDSFKRSVPYYIAYFVGEGRLPSTTEAAVLVASAFAAVGADADWQGALDREVEELVPADLRAAYRQVMAPHIARLVVNAESLK